MPHSSKSRRKSTKRAKSSKSKPPSRRHLRKKSSRKRSSHKSPVQRFKSRKSFRKSRKSTSPKGSFKSRRQSFKKLTADQACSLPGYDVSVWEKVPAVRAAYLTLGDLKKMKRGDKIKVLSLHRNVFDTANEANDPNRSYTAKQFFQRDGFEYIHESGVKGSIRMHFEKSFRPFTFEIEYKPYRWYPLSDDGTLPVKGDVGTLLGVKKHYTAFPDSTPVGWRGPMIPWSKLEDLPRIFWLYDDFQGETDITTLPCLQI